MRNAQNYYCFDINQNYTEQLPHFQFAKTVIITLSYNYHITSIYFWLHTLVKYIIPIPNPQNWVKSFGETSHKWILQPHAPVINYAMKYSSILTQLLDCWIWFTSRHSMRTSAFGKFHTGKGTCHANHRGYFKSAPLILMCHIFFWGGALHCLQKWKKWCNLL